MKLKGLSFFTRYLIGVAALTLGASLSTQWFAAQVGYHPQLGQPLMSEPVPLYAPWSWFAWALAAFADDSRLVLATALPIFASCISGFWWLLRTRPTPPSVPAFWRRLRSRPAPAEHLSPDHAGVAAPAAEQTAGAPADSSAARDATLALTLSDADVELVEDPPAAHSEIHLENLDQVFPRAEDPSPQRRADMTVRADAPSYDVVRRLSAHSLPDSDSASCDASPLQVDGLDATAEHDAPTAEAPARSLPQPADTAASPSCPTGSSLEVEPARADWAHEVATAEAPSRSLPADTAARDDAHPDTGRFESVRTAEQPSPDPASPGGSDFPEVVDDELLEEIHRQLTEADLDGTIPDDAAAKLASLEVGSSTQQLGPAESAALAAFARSLANKQERHAVDAASITAEKPAVESSGASGTASDTSQDSSPADEEEWLL